MKKLFFSPSLMCANSLNLKKDIKLLINAKFDFLHLDVMDLNFVPNLTLGFDLINKLTQYQIPLDIHLMVNNVELAVNRLKTRPIDYITFHIEAPTNIQKLIALIKNQAHVGLAISPDTPIEKLKPYINQVDLILLMSVYPGFAGQPFLPKVYDKVRNLMKLVGKSKKNIIISVDGGIGFEQIKQFKAIGANMFVLGTKSLFMGDLENDIKRFIGGVA